MHATTWMNPENMLSERNQTQNIVHESIYRKCLERTNLQRQKADRNVLKLDCDNSNCTFTKNH